MSRSLKSGGAPAQPRPIPTAGDGGSGPTSLDLRGGSSRAGDRYVPLYEAKMIHQFDHRWATYEADSRDASDAEKRNPDFDAKPRYWVPESEVVERLASKGWKKGWLIGLRGIANATNERTIVAGLWPYSGAGNSCHIWFLDHSSPRLIAALYACMCSLSLDYVARQKIGGTNLNFFYVEQFPVLPPSVFFEEDLNYVVPRVVELTSTRSLSR